MWTYQQELLSSVREEEDQEGEVAEGEHQEVGEEGRLAGVGVLVKEGVGELEMSKGHWEKQKGIQEEEERQV